MGAGERVSRKGSKSSRKPFTLYNPQLVNVIRYADDFIVTARSKEILEQKVLPFIEEFLKLRGLKLSVEKTHIRHVEQGFDFLGHNIRLFDNNQLIIQPSKKSVNKIIMSVKEVFQKHKAIAHPDIIGMLNPKIKGWANFFKAACAYKAFSKVDNHIFLLAYKWAKRRHNNKSAKWIKENYFPTRGTRNWSFNTTFLGEEFVLNKMEDVKIIRHVKVRNSANWYDKTHKMYFFKRKNKRTVKPRKSRR